MNVYHWVTAKYTCCCSFSNTFFNWSDVFFWYCTTDNLTFKCDSRSFFSWCNSKMYITVLTRTTGLSYKLTLCFCRLCNRFSVCYLWVPMLASTLNSRSNLSTIISRCNSPIPEIIVCPVSSSVFVTNVGSSSASF